MHFLLTWLCHPIQNKSCKVLLALPPKLQALDFNLTRWQKSEMHTHNEVFVFIVVCTIMCWAAEEESIAYVQNFAADLSLS